MKDSGIIQDKFGKTWLHFTGVSIRCGAFVAKFELIETPASALSALQEHERLVIQHVLRDLDGFDAKISSYGLNVVWDGNSVPQPIKDFQIVDNEVSFRLRE